MAAETATTCSFLLLFCTFSPMFGQRIPSTLKVAVCDPGQVPYASIDDDGKLVGFDVDTWTQVYFALQSRVQSMLLDPSENGTITPEITYLVGGGPPALIPMKSSSILSSLQNGTIDIGMCGYFVTTDRLINFDFTSPSYFMSGLQAVVRKGAADPSIAFVLLQLISTVDELAQLTVVVLLIFAMVFGHLIAAVENLKFGSQRDFRNNFFEGTQDGMWFSIVVMSTVGFGDIVPRTSLGRFLTIVWIFLSIVLMTILSAIITTNFGNLVLVPKRPVELITSPYDLAPFKVGTALQYAHDRLLQQSPNMAVVKFAQNTQPDVFRSLLNDSIEVAVDRYEAIQYYNTMEAEFQDQLLPVGPVFNHVGVAFGVRRGPNGTSPHPLLHLLSLASADVTRGQWDTAAATAALWFGDGSLVSSIDPTLPALERAAVANVNEQTAVTLAALFIAWALLAVILCVRNYPHHCARNHVCAAVREAVGIREPGGDPMQLRAQALAGLRALAEEWAAAGPQGDEAGLAPAANKCCARTGPCDPGNFSEAAPRLGLERFARCVAAGLARRQAPMRWWHPLTLLDYARPVPGPVGGSAEPLGLSLARGALYDSCRAVAALLDDWRPPGAQTALRVEEMAVVVADAAGREAYGWLAEGGPIFARAAFDSQERDAELSFHQVK